VSWYSQTCGSFNSYHSIFEVHIDHVGADLGADNSARFVFAPVLPGDRSDAASRISASPRRTGMPHAVLLGPLITRSYLMSAALRGGMHLSSQPSPVRLAVTGGDQTMIYYQTQCLRSLKTGSSFASRKALSVVFCTNAVYQWRPETFD
jgi:hypothetical protein